MNTYAGSQRARECVLQLMAVFLEKIIKLEFEEESEEVAKSSGVLDVFWAR